MSIHRRRGDDPAGLGRGQLTRWLPVLGRPPRQAPVAAPPTSGEGTTARRFTLRTIFAARQLTLPAAFLSTVHQVGEALVPVVMGLAIDRGLASGDMRQTGFWLLVLGLDFLMLSLGFRFAALLSTRAVQLTQHRLRSMLSAAALHPRHRTIGQADGAVLSTATNDVSGLSLAVTIGVFPIGSLVGIGFIAVTLFVIYWPLGVAVAIGAPVAVAAMGAMSGPFARSRHRSQTLLAAAVGQATDLVAGYRVIKGVGAEHEATRRYRSSSRAALSGAHRSVGALGRYLAGSNGVSGAFVAAVAGLAGWFAVDGRISVGELIAVVGLAQVLLPPLNMLTSDTVTWWATAVASGGRILDLLADSVRPAPPNELGADAAAPSALPPVELRLDDDEQIRVEPGELVGVHADDRVAARIVATLLDPEAGETRVLIDGIAAGQLDRSVYRSRVTVAPHEAVLFSGTIAENLDVPGAPPGLRRAALTAAACDDFSTVAQGGRERQVGQNGDRLSGGQRQRVALARALAVDAPVLVLHDPTTSVDAVTETAIADRLREIRNGRSTLLIASSPALLSRCDRVVDLRRATAGVP
ncbi:ABC transporter ATP-binding protein [Microbacterium gubbeenense]|uniref:ABC transporter ATP-binding protein n=1 Tax=Microbacterium gubbeenense TaxID=159896 RepID=UPI000A0481ED|nr:ABC transporter ATP-binding protein [Microbacterium gubbeenense]